MRVGQSSMKVEVVTFHRVVPSLHAALPHVGSRFPPPQSGAGVACFELRADLL